VPRENTEIFLSCHRVDITGRLLCGKNMIMEKLNMTKTYKTYYSAKNKPELVAVKPAQFISIAGKGDPSEQAYANHLQALYAVAYTIKFMCKDLGKDFVVAKLEGLWSFDESKYKGLSITDSAAKVPRSEWLYRMLLRLPDFVSKRMLAEAIQTVLAKKQLSLAKQVEWFEMNEGKVVQMLHKGPFNTEPETLLQMQQFIQTHNLKRNGLHHEIYLSDVNKTPPEKLRTILREPVK
jgi:hypothetical protein